MIGRQTNMYSRPKVQQQIRQGKRADGSGAALKVGWLETQDEAAFAWSNDANLLELPVLANSPLWCTRHRFPPLPWRLGYSPGVGVMGIRLKAFQRGEKTFQDLKWGLACQA